MCHIHKMFSPDFPSWLGNDSGLHNSLINFVWPLKKYLRTPVLGSSRCHGPRSMSCLRLRLTFDKTYLYFIQRYGDTAPRSIPARLYSILWMIIGMIAFSVLTANITSSLSHQTFDAEERLFGKKVGWLCDWRCIYQLRIYQPPHKF